MSKIEKPQGDKQNSYPNMTQLQTHILAEIAKERPGFFAQKETASSLLKKAQEKHAQLQAKQLKEEQQKQQPKEVIKEEKIITVVPKKEEAQPTQPTQPVQLTQEAQPMQEAKTTLWKPSQSQQQRGRFTDGARPPYDPNRPRPPYDPNRPRPPYDPSKPRPPYDPSKPRPPYDPNRPKPPFDPNRPRPAYGQRPPYAAGASRPAFNRPVTPVLSSISTFVKKDNSRSNTKKDYSRSGTEEGRVAGAKKQRERFFVGSFESALDYEAEQAHGNRRKLKQSKEKTPVAIVALETAVITKTHLTVKEFSEKISTSVSEILKKLMQLGLMLTINSVIDVDTAELIANEFGIKLEFKIEKSFEEKIKAAHKTKKDANAANKRAPVVVIMGHVDHGKTSLLDTIRKTKITAIEAGGITQHIGAYSIVKNNEAITFIDTPGHEAFSAMRERGARVTDVAILVVAADDGIKEQTVEAIKHIQDAKVPMIVAVNKVDKESANIERIKQQLTEHNVVPEEWGGDTIIVPVSAHSGFGIDKLLETILFVSQVQDLTATHDKEATGTVLEAKLDKARGVVATLLVQDGTLKIGDHVIAGTSFGKIKAMIDDEGKNIKKAIPSQPVAVIGLDFVPSAGDYFYIVDANMSRKVIEERKNKIKEDRMQAHGLTAEKMLTKISEGKLKNLKLIIKADVAGSSEALKTNLTKLGNDEVRVTCISAVAGQITESDIAFAQTSGAIIIAFNIKVDSKMETLAKQHKVTIKQSKIIYEAAQFVEKEAKKLREPKYKEETLGKLDITHIFKLSSNGTIAGGRVVEGKLERGALVRIHRAGEIVLAKDTIESIKILKDEQKEVSKGHEAGIRLKSFVNYQIGDVMECYKLVLIEE